LKRYLRNTLKAFAIFIGLLIVLYAVAYIYLSANKKYIISQVKQQVAQKLNGEIQISNIDLTFLASFPSISILLENVAVRDTLYNQHKHPFFDAQKIYASISVVNVIKRQKSLVRHRVENGNLYIFTDTTGYTNSYLLTPKSKAWYR
jgi:hypothetical protein